MLAISCPAHACQLIEPLITSTPDDQLMPGETRLKVRVMSAFVRRNGLRDINTVIAYKAEILDGGGVLATGSLVKFVAPAEMLGACQTLYFEESIGSDGRVSGFVRGRIKKGAGKIAVLDHRLSPENSANWVFGNKERERRYEWISVKFGKQEGVD